MELLVDLYQVPVPAPEIIPAAGDGQALHQPLDPHPGPVGVLHREAPPHAALGAGAQLDEIRLRQAAVLDLLQHADTIFNAVHGQVPLAQPGGGLSPAEGPAHPHDARRGEGLHLLEVLHGAQQAQVDVPNGEGAVQHRLLESLRAVGRRHLGGAGHDGKDPDLLRRQAGLGLRLPSGQDGGQFHRRHRGGNVGDQLGKAHADEPHDGGAGGGDLGHDPGLSAADGVPGVVGEDLRRLGGLKDLLEADLQQAVEHDVDVVQMLELPVEGRVGQGHPVFVLLQLVQAVADGFDRLVRAHLDALAAVDAPLIEDGGLAAADPHGLSRAVFDAGGTAPTALILQDDRVLHHKSSPPG